jgi:DNA-binding NarL/FixJ family response regulator
MSHAPIRIALVEDQDNVRAELERLLARNPSLQVVLSLPDGDAALRELGAASVDLVLMDLDLPGLSGSECIRRLKMARPDLCIVVLTQYEDPDHLFEALQAGANGYILKSSSPAELEAGVLQARVGGAPMTGEIAVRVLAYFHRLGARTRQAEALTPRERDVLDLLAQGYAYKHIADRLGLKLDTINGYIKSIYRKLGVHSAVEATRFARGNA